MQIALLHLTEIQLRTYHKCAIRSIVSCQRVLLGEDGNFVEQDRVGDKVGVDWQSQKHTEGAIEFIAFHTATPQSHKEGVGNLQCPVPRRNGLIAGTKPTKKGV